MPGLTWGATLKEGVPLTLRAIAPGELSAHALWLSDGQSLKAALSLDAHEASLFLYGPRNASGGLPGCLPLTLPDTQDLELSLSGLPLGEYALVVGPYPGGQAIAEASLTLTCQDGCTSEPSPCPTLQELGCPAIRCDGALARDEQGCLTCLCQTGRVCGPDRSDGPSASCILPACDCSATPAAPVCGADGHTWPSACDALCAGVHVAYLEPCEAICPELSACEETCWGTRALDPQSGCPTCSCASSLPETPKDCEACSMDEAPVCGMDGVTYRNRCVARCAGVKLLYRAACVEGCRSPPTGCDLDCPHGLRFSAECVLCDCAPAPELGCMDVGDTVCVRVPSLQSKTSVGSPCLAESMGASEGSWGPCATPCDDETPCPLGTQCVSGGALEGRCLLIGDSIGGCSRLLEPICGGDGANFPNACLARLEQTREAHRASCCSAEEPPPCTEGSWRRPQASGCPAPEGACEPTPSICLPPGMPSPEACDLQGTHYESVCAAHLKGRQASPLWCRE